MRSTLPQPWWNCAASWCGATRTHPPCCATSPSPYKVGGIQEQRGQLDDALTAYTEALHLVRRIHTSYDDTPQSLRDHSLSLDNVTRIQQNGINSMMQTVPRLGKVDGRADQQSVELISRGAVDPFTEQVGMTVVPGVLSDHVQQDPAQ